MDAEDENGSSFLFVPTLSLLNIPSPNADSPPHPGMATPPLQILASVPFRWEEKPGKPINCAAAITVPEPTRFLELPPCRLQFLEPTTKMGKTPSPTTVLDGPYNSVGRSKFSSFRFFSENHDSFDSNSTASPEITAMDDFWLGNKSGGGQLPVAAGLFGRNPKWKGGRRDIDGNDLDSTNLNASCDGERSSRKQKSHEKMIRRKGSFSAAVLPTKSTWAGLFQGLKQVMPWKSGKK